MGLKTNLISHWKLDESSDGSAQVNRADSHGANTLTDVNTTPSGAGKISNGADMEATNSEYLKITEAAQSGLDISGSFTTAFWVKFESTTGLNFPFITKWVTQDGGDLSHGYIAPSFYYNGIDLGLYGRISTDGVNGLGGEVLWNPTLGTWYYITTVCVINGASSYFRFYVNGSQVGTDQTFTASSIFNGTADFYVGSWYGISNYFDGVVDEISIWSRALSGTEITQLYNSGNGLAFGAWEAISDKFFLMF